MVTVENLPTVLPVVAAALIDPVGHILLQKRPETRTHGGLWEFPGGKVEPYERAIDALVRELSEELGIVLEPDRPTAIGFAEAPLGDRSLLLLLYACRCWHGTAVPREQGAALRWIEPAALGTLDMPPADLKLCAALERFLAAGS